jgi:hypothetical protein
MIPLDVGGPLIALAIGAGLVVYVHWLGRRLDRELAEEAAEKDRRRRG